MFVHLVFKKIFQSYLSSSCCCTAVVTDTLICISCMYICILCICMNNLYVYVLYTYTHIRSNRILELDQVQYYICITLHLIDLYCAIRTAHTHTRTHTHKYIYTYIYMYIYIYICVCVWNIAPVRVVIAIRPAHTSTTGGGGVVVKMPFW